MKITFLVLVLVAFAQSLPTTVEEFDKLFKIREYVPAHIKEKEQQRLQEVEAEIEAQNLAFAQGVGHFEEKLTEMADIPKADFEKMFEGMKMPKVMTRATGLIMPPESERNTPENQANLEVAYRELAMTRQATSWDSRSKGWVTAVKNQGNCGSCSAFAAHAEHEITLVKAGAKLSGMDLSEQHLIDCGYNQEGMNGCNGAAPHAYQKWFVKNGGVSKHESKYPYLGRSPKLTCTAANKVANWNPGYKISNVTYDFECTESKMMKLVASKGAVATGIYASDDSFQSYKSGVYDKCTKNDMWSMNHAVVVVGYGNDTKLGDYWIIKNSWGTNWGDEGYIKLQRGSTQCGIGGLCIWTDAAANGSANNTETTTAAPATTAAPSNTNMWCNMTELFRGDNSVNDTFHMRVYNWQKSRIFYSIIRCEKSQCTPAENGPTNACQYICGEDKCDGKHLEHLDPATLKEILAGDFIIKQGGQRVMLPTKNYLTMGDEGCLQNDVFTWVWAEDGEWGWIVPKTKPWRVVDLWGKKAALWSKHSGDNQKFKFDGKMLVSKALSGYAMATTADGILEAVPIEDGSASQVWTVEKAPEAPGNSLPTTGRFALKNNGTGETVGMGGDGRYLKSGGCVEFEYKLDADEVWGVLKPHGNNKVVDFWSRQGIFGMWHKHDGNNQRFRMEGKYLLSKIGKAVKPRSDGKIGVSQPACNDKNEQWEILVSCPVTNE